MPHRRRRARRPLDRGHYRSRTLCRDRTALAPRPAPVQGLPEMLVADMGQRRGGRGQLGIQDARAAQLVPVREQQHLQGRGAGARRADMDDGAAHRGVSARPIAAAAGAAPGTRSRRVVRDGPLPMPGRDGGLWAWVLAAESGRGSCDLPSQARISPWRPGDARGSAALIKDSTSRPRPAPRPNPATCSGRGPGWAAPEA